MPCRVDWGPPCRLGLTPIPEAPVPVCSESAFNPTLLFAPQKKAEAAHRILEGLGPQVELVSQAWLGRVGGWRNGVGQQVLGGGGVEEEEVGEVMYCPALSPGGGRKQHFLIRTMADNSGRWAVSLSLPLKPARCSSPTAESTPRLTGLDSSSLSLMTM